MLKAKSDEKSDEFKNDGNIFYKRLEFYNSLMCYNKSLCFAEGKENLALAYGNRSAVYFSLKKYDECLLNIQLARKNYPTDKIQKLNEREEKCKEMKASTVHNPIDDAWDFFKLSYPANPKIPFLVEGIEMKSDGGIYTKRDLKAGDVIAIEDFSFKRIFCPGQYNRCCCCAKVSMMNLIPCKKTASLMYCSEDCRKKTYKAYGDDLESMLVYAQMFIDGDRMIKDIETAFGGHEKLLKFLTGNDFTKLNKTVFDYKWNDKNHPKYNENLMKCFLSLGVNEWRPPFILFPLFPPPSVNFTKGRAEIIDLAQNIFQIVNSRTTMITYHDYKFAEQVCPEAVHDGLGISVLSESFKHSCMSNIQHMVVDNKFATIVTKPIKAGEQLYRNYVQIFSYFNSIREMRIPSHMKCSCFACEHNLKPRDFSTNDPRVVEDARENAEIAFRNVKKMRDALKSNWDFITARCEDITLSDVPLLMQTNCELLANMAYKASFPC